MGRISISYGVLQYTYGRVSPGNGSGVDGRAPATAGSKGAKTADVYRHINAGERSLQRPRRKGPPGHQSEKGNLHRLRRRQEDGRAFFHGNHKGSSAHWTDNRSLKQGASLLQAAAGSGHRFYPFDPQSK